LAYSGDLDVFSRADLLAVIERLKKNLAWYVEERNRLIEERNAFQREVTRYRLTAPVVDGNAFWEINDMQENVNLVSISKNFPNAEERARLLYDVLTNGDN
jgi:hypothetical protein